jgi:hypothetical protein
LCAWFGYFLPVCRNGQQWVHRNAAQILTFAKFLCDCNYTQSGWVRPETHSSKPCDNDSEVLGIKWAVPGICTGCPTGAKQSATHMAIEHLTQWLWSQSEWSPPALWSGTNESPAWRYEPSEHDNFDDIPTSGVSEGPYVAAYGVWRYGAVRWWWGWRLIMMAMKSLYASLNIQPIQSHQLMQNSQMAWKIRRCRGVQENWIEFDCISYKIIIVMNMKWSQWSTDIW